MIARLFWRYWAWRSLRLAEYHRDAAWDHYCAQGMFVGAERHDVARCWLCDQICADHIKQRDLHYARYDRARAALAKALP